MRATIYRMYTSVGIIGKFYYVEMPLTLYLVRGTILLSSEAITMSVSSHMLIYMTFDMKHVNS